MRRAVWSAFGVAFSATVAFASEAEGGGGSSALITPQIGTIFWTALTFLILVIFLRVFAWKPLLGAIDERERAIRESQEQARRDRDEAKSLLEQHRGMLDEARSERLAALEAGRKDAERLKSEILDEAKRQREQTIRQAEVQVETMVRQARAELRASTSDLAVAVASKLIARNLDDATQRKLVEEYIADLEKRSGPKSDAPS